MFFLSWLKKVKDRSLSSAQLNYREMSKRKMCISRTQEKPKCKRSTKAAEFMRRYRYKSGVRDREIEKDRLRKAV